jgi:hypothetical protein
MTEQDDLLKRIIASANAGQEVPIRWSELQPCFSDGTDKQQWQRMVDWAKMNNLAFWAGDIKLPAATKTIEADIFFWSSLRGIDHP